VLKRYLCLMVSMCAANAWAIDLTDLEQKWLHAAWPVIVYAKAVNLPVDIIVQPEAKPTDVPMALGYDDGRCKLVLSLRGNPQAEASLAGTTPAQQQILIETMAAHEMGHCWRYVQGKWLSRSSGFNEVHNNAESARSIDELHDALEGQRSEEGFADLVGLAWVQQFHPERYQQIYAWMQALRNDQALMGGDHDTLAWVQLASDGKRFGKSSTLFEQATMLWRQAGGA
jgi:hypothetical protein